MRKNDSKKHGQLEVLNELYKLHKIVSYVYNEKKYKICKLKLRKVLQAAKKNRNENHFMEYKNQF